MGDDRDLVNHLLDALEQKKTRNLLRLSYYESKRALKLVTNGVVPPQYYRLGLVLAWAAKPVDLLARRCRLQGMVWDNDLESLSYGQVWDDNMLGQTLSSAATSSLTYGVSYLINVKGAPGEKLTSQVHVRDALHAIGDWDKRNRCMKNLLTVNDWDNGRPTDWALYLPGRTITGLLVDGRWQIDNPATPWDGLWVEPLAYKWGPDRPFGRSRITRPSMGLQDAAVRALVRLEGHLDIYSYPELWMLGADESIFKNDDGSRKDVFDLRMGRIKGIQDDEEAQVPRADVKQFAASDPTPHLAGLNAYAKMFAREAGLPDSAVAITDVSNPTSADSYDASQYELIAEAEGATDDWTPAVSRTVRRALAIAEGMNEVPPEWASMTCQWKNPRFLSRAAEADAGMKQLSAVPWLANTKVGLRLLGLSPTDIDNALAEQRRAQGREMFAQIAASQPSGPVQDGG